MSENTLRTITVGQLRQALEGYGDDVPVFFGQDDLTFYRVKDRRGYPPLVQLEFDELYETTLRP